MIETQGLTKYYGNYPAIRDVTFAIDEGEIVAFLGPNAAGKTTTMRILTGFLPASDGVATIAGFDVAEESIEARRCIGYLPETMPYYPDLTVYQFLSYCARLRDVPATVREDLIDSSMQRCRVDDRADDIMGKLSKGYRQRVGLAQAMVHDPKVLILDEPTIGLDPAQIQETREVIRDLGKSHTVLLSTHILSEAEQVCERVLIIHEGHLIADDTPDNLSARVRGGPTVRVKVLDGGGGVARALEEIGGVVRVRKDPSQQEPTYLVDTQGDNDLRPQIASVVVKKGWSLLELGMVAMSLEDVFIRLTEHPAQPSP